MYVVNYVAVFRIESDNVLISNLNLSNLSFRLTFSNVYIVDTVKYEILF